MDRKKKNRSLWQVPSSVAIPDTSERECRSQCRQIFGADVFDGFDGAVEILFRSLGLRGSDRWNCRRGILLAAGLRDSSIEITHETRSPRVQQKGPNSRTAYRFSTDHRMREYLSGIFLSSSLSFCLCSFFPFSFLRLALSKNLHFYCHSARLKTHGHRRHIVCCS